MTTDIGYIILLTISNSLVDNVAGYDYGAEG